MDLAIPSIISGQPGNCISVADSQKKIFVEISRSPSYCSTDSSNPSRLHWLRSILRDSMAVAVVVEAVANCS